jgi:hypothetical protein
MVSGPKTYNYNILEMSEQSSLVQIEQSSPVKIERKPVKKKHNLMSPIQHKTRKHLMSEPRNSRNIMSTISINQGMSELDGRVLSPKISMWSPVKRFAKKRGIPLRCLMYLIL